MGIWPPPGYSCDLFTCSTPISTTTSTPPEFSPNVYYKVPDPEPLPEDPQPPPPADHFGDRVMAVLRTRESVKAPRGWAPVVAHACGRR